MKLDNELIRIALFKRRIKQYEAAQQIGISEYYFSMILSGRRQATPLVVVKLAQILQCDPRFLILNSAGARINAEMKFRRGSSSTQGGLKSRPTSKRGKLKRK